MAYKIFVSYKYKDSNVYPLNGLLDEVFNPTTVRTYVDSLEELFDNSDVIYKGESDDEDLSDLSEDTIWEKLKDRIYDSSITIVLISPNMKEPNRSDKSQWIPWEISYSLKETTRNDRTSRSNAILAIVLPDSGNSYNYFWKNRQCDDCKCYSYNYNIVFTIIQLNVFNKKTKSKIDCQLGNNIYSGDTSYITVVKWSDFTRTPQKYIELAVEKQKNISDYEIRKEV